MFVSSQRRKYTLPTQQEKIFSAQSCLQDNFQIANESNTSVDILQVIFKLLLPCDVVAPIHLRKSRESQANRVSSALLIGQEYAISNQKWAWTN